MTTLHVACAAHGDYVAHSAAMLHSLLEHRGESEVQVHYLHSSQVRRRARERLERMVTEGGGSIRFHPAAERAVAGLPVPDGSTAAIWYRILLPELLGELPRVLYLDVDLVVVDSLDRLWETELGDHHVAAVTNVFEPWSMHHPERLGLAGPQEYFNTGVLLMNLALMRRDRTTEMLRRAAVDHAAELLWPEQDTLNIVLGGDRLGLHPRWNCMNSVMHLPESVSVFGADVVAEAQRHPAIRHFEGAGINKPWHPQCRWAMRDVYIEHRQRSPWPMSGLSGAAGGSLTARTWRRVADRVRRR